MRETAEDRRESEAVANARNRIATLAAHYGTNHPEYASGLNQLALLLIMHGDPGSAEPLLSQALEVRRVALGERHPDYATNLSSLGGLLWARALSTRRSRSCVRPPRSATRPSGRSTPRRSSASRASNNCWVRNATWPRPRG